MVTIIGLRAATRGIPKSAVTVGTFSHKSEQSMTAHNSDFCLQALFSSLLQMSAAVPRYGCLHQLFYLSVYRRDFPHICLTPIAERAASFRHLLLASNAILNITLR